MPESSGRPSNFRVVLLLLAVVGDAEAVLRRRDWPLKNNLLLTAARQSLRSELLRPIITGCSAACGIDDTSCVTQCQVCVESFHCKTVHDYDCQGCLVDSQKALSTLKGLDPFVRDGGGVPLQHEMVRQELLQARLEAVEAKRALRRAEAGVISAQRKAEWAAEEQREAASKFRQGQMFMLRAQANAAKWESHNAGKMKALRTTVEERRRAHGRTHLELEAAEERHAQALKRAAERHAEAKLGQPGTARELEAVAGSAAASGEDVRELRRVQTAQWRGLQRAQEKLRKRVEDSLWLDAGLQHDMRNAASAAKEMSKELAIMRVMERQSIKRIEVAKEVYRAAASRSQRCDLHIAALEEELRKHPLEKPLEDEEDIFKRIPTQPAAHN